MTDGKKKQYPLRPLNPPRYHSTDGVSVPRRPESPVSPTSAGQTLRHETRSVSPNPTSSTSPNRAAPSPTPSSSSFRKPVPQYDQDVFTSGGNSAPTTPSGVPLIAPRPTNPNPFGTGVKPSLARATPPPLPLHPSFKQARSDSPDDFAVLNFGRRPSAVDPLAPSSSTGRPLMAMSPGPSPTRASNQASAAAAAQAAARPEHHRARSHTRQPSISLSSGGQAGTSPLPSPTSVVSPTSSTVSTAREQAKILPLQPVPTRTRAPMEAFASVEMLQGQREHQDRTRGQEVFGRDGKYEGRASISNATGEAMNWNRRQDPTENLRIARGSQRVTAGVPSLPPIEVDVASIATQLREHDARRGSEDRRDLLWRQSDEDESTSPSEFIATKNFSFPNRSATSVASHQTPETDIGAEGDFGGPYSEKSLFGDVFSSKDRLTGGGAGGGWRTEHLGNSEKALQMQRPSIVALPVYPAPNGSASRSFKYKLKRVAQGLSWITVVLANAATGVYLWKRIEAMLIVEDRMPSVFVGAWCFLVLEILVAVLTGIASMYHVFSFRVSGNEPKMRLRGDANLPAIDVFVVSSGHSDQTVFDCAAAAASMDYPPHRYRVMVLDPMSSADLQLKINQHAKSKACPHLSYHRRQLGASSTLAKRASLGNASEGDLFQTKASSINFGMMEASTFGVKGPAEYIAVLDADMIPERNYLRAALPSILGDGKVALVKTGHGYMNLPLRLSQSTATMMNAADAPTDCRSGFLLRRAALVEIGGFPADSWIQDGQCEALLLGRGYKVAQVDEVLQWSMARPTYVAQINAMMVNRLGPLRTAARLRFFMGGEAIKLMPFTARVKALARGLSPLFSLIALLLATVYPFMFSFGGILVLSPDLDNLNTLLQLTLLTVVLHRVHDLVWCWSTNQLSPRREFQAWMFSAAYSGFAVLRLVLPRRLGGYARGSDININAVSSRTRPGFFKRLGLLILDPNTGVIVGFSGAFGVAVWRIVRDCERGTVDQHQTALTALLTVAWPSLLWIEFLMAAMVPLSCLMFPSRLLTESRELFLIRDHYTQVARPKQNYKTAAPFKVRRWPEFLVGTVVIAWAVTAVCLAEFTDVFA